jgi:hypothetical protein
MMHSETLLKSNPMIRKSMILSLLALVATSCQQKEEVRLIISNPLDHQRNDAIVLLTRSAIENWIQLADGMIPVLTDTGGETIPGQLDDVDGDGNWDELFCLIDMGPLEQATLLLTLIPPERLPSFEPRTNLRLGANEPGYPELHEAERLEGITYHNHGRTGEVYQMEGPAWENDRVGFRNYLDQRNGMDIFGKITPEMVLDSVGIASRQSYHEPDTWGMDVLKVGTSLGAGSIGYLYNDSIYRVGDNGSGNYKVVFEGPLRSRFNLTYDLWMIGDKQVGVLHQIEIIAGRHCYQSMVTVMQSEGDLSLVAGIVNMKSDTLYKLDLDPQFTGFLTHDLQAEDTTLLGMALIVPGMDLASYGETEKSGEGVTETYYAVINAPDQEPVPYRFYALWEREDPRWASLAEIQSFLKEEAARWTQSLMIEVEQ